MDTTLAVTIFVNFIILFLGMISFFHKRDSITNFLFFLISVSTVLWSFSNYFSVKASPEESLLWIRLVLFFAAPHAVFFLLFIYHFPRQKIALGRWKLGGLLALLFFVMWATLSPYVFSGVMVENGLVIPTPGPLMPVFAAVVLGSLGFGVFLAVKKYRATADLEKMQWRFMLFGITVSYAALIFTNFILVIMYHNTSFISLGPLFMLPLTIGTTYAILEHHLLNIKVIATEIIAFIILSISFFEILLAGNWLEMLVRMGVFVIFFFFSLLLIRSVVREVEQREKLQVLTLELESANKGLRQLDQAKSEFISIASHQLRAPLTVIKGYISMLIEGMFGELSIAGHEAMTKVAFSTDQLVKLISDLLNLSRIESGKIRYEFKEVNLSELLEKAVNEFLSAAEKKERHLLFQNTAGRVVISADPDKLREVVVNLLDNAIKYSTREISLRLEKLPGKIKMEIADDGIGLSPEDISKLFIKFSRSAEAQRHDPNGMGIGLYFVKRVVEDHGGRVWAESAGLGKGSTFMVELPINKI